MAGTTKTIIGTLAAFFNEGEGKRPLTEFQKEIKALSDPEKLELATLAAAEMGITLKV
jgi:hypothetical protein